MSARRAFPRPERFVAQVSVAVLLLLAWQTVAHASGSGWVQAVGALAAGLVVVGMVTPAFVARRLEIACAAAPRDGRTGTMLSIEITSDRPLRCTPLTPGGPPALVSGRSPARLELLPPFRGVLGEIDVKLATAAPLGLLWWSVTRRVALSSPVLIAPCASAMDGIDVAVPEDDALRGQPAPAMQGDLRGVRAYRHGDSRRLVHWRATAHTSRLMVRELEEHAEQPVRVVAHLPEDPVAAEVRASAALASVEALLSARRRVILETDEDGRVVSRAVSDPLSAGRRLARAGSNPYLHRSPSRR